MEYYLTSKDSISKTLMNCKSGDIIRLAKGVYDEKIEILVDNIKIIGEDQNETIITNNNYYHKIMSDFNECNTFRTFTCYVGGNNVEINNLTIQNTAVPAKKYGQAVALHVHGNNFLCQNVTLKSEQDTLFTGPLPQDLILRHQGFLKPYFLYGVPSVQKYQNCKIYGNVDFIFGSATALFEKCDIITINRKENEAAYICAPSHPQDLEFGYLFYKCNLLTENCECKYYLGRPWRDFGCAAFIECNMGSSILPAGWDKWGNTNRDKTARFYEYSEDTDVSSRVSWANMLTKNEAIDYVKKFMEFCKKREK